MPFSATPKTLMVFSSPDGQDRLRLDREHKAIDEVLAKRQLPPTIIRRIHAATLRDVGIALREEDYELVLFSCHGNDNGVFLESRSGDDCTHWSVLAKTLKDAAPNLSVIIINACYSASGQNALHLAASFVIVIEGSPDDGAAIAFSQHFFDEFYRSSAVEPAFRQALSALEQIGLGIRPVLSRREPSGRSVVQACFSLRHDSIFLDLTEAEESVAQLPISRHQFLSLLTRKIRIHSWIFKVERDRAVLPIGQFFGVFSWQNANDLVICHRVLQLKPDVDVAECTGWTRLVVIYNDLRSERYRMIGNPSAEENRGLLSEALDRVETCYAHALRAAATAGQKRAPRQYTVTVSTVRVQCDMARQNLTASDLARVVIALETALSSIHDLVDELTAAMTISLSDI